MAGLASVASALGTVVSAVGTLAAGSAAAAQANFQAKQLDKKAKEERAASQREALQQKKETAFLQSRGQAVAGASGLGALDETVVDLAGDLEQEGAYRQGMTRYAGEERARGYEDSATGARLSGQASQIGSYFGAAGTLLSGYSSWYDKYGLNKTGSTSLRYG